LMGLAALAMIIGGVTAPLIARHIRPGYVVAASLVLSAIGYVLLAIIGNDAPSGVALAVSGLALAYLGNGTIAALGTDLVVGSAPPEKAGSASAMTETVQDLGISLGIAVLGSVSAAVYRHMIALSTPESLSQPTREAVSDSLWAALAAQAELPAGLIEEARAAFTTGLNGASALSAVSVAVLAILAAVALRHVGRLGQPED